jgi:iron(III) transport system ATP-binding protein
MSFLSVAHVGKRYGAVAALSDVSLGMDQGSRLAVLGPSGSGKTTLLRILAGFEAPDTGRVVLDGEVLAGNGTPVPSYKRRIGIVMQDGALFPHLTVTENIGFGLDRAMPGRAARIAELLDMVGLDSAIGARSPEALSGGQQQRVALARALARAPRLMLLDEPFSALDTALREVTRKAVADLLRAAGITTILVTHDQAEALSFADQVAVMGDGHLLQIGAPQSLYRHPVSKKVASVLGEAIILPAWIGDGMAHCVLGAIPVNDPTPRAQAEIMLRPEQIALGGGGVTATVVANDFAGAFCTLTLQLAGGERLQLRQSSLGAPAPGQALVTVGVIGAAHLFSA